MATVAVLEHAGAGEMKRALPRRESLHHWLARAASQRRYAAEAREETVAPRGPQARRAPQIRTWPKCTWRRRSTCHGKPRMPDHLLSPDGG